MASTSLTFNLFGKDVSASRSLQGVGKAAGGVGSAFKGMATVAGGALAAIGIANVGANVLQFGKDSVEAFAAVGGETMKLQRFMGGTAEDASRLGHAFRMSGLDSDVAAKSLGILSRNLANGSKAFGQAGISIKDASGHLKPMNDLLPQIAERFRAMPDGPAKTALAMKLFGRNGVAMLPFLNKGAAGLAEMAKESDALGTTLGGKDLAAVKESTKAKRTFGEAVKGLQISLGRELYPILTAVTQFMSNQVVPVVRTVVAWLREHKDVVGKVALAIGVLVVALGGAAKVIQTVTAVMRIWTAVQAAFNAVMAANPIVLIILAIVALVALLVVAYKKFDWFRNFVDTVWDGIQAVIAGFVEWWKSTAWPIVKRVIDFVVAYYTFLWNAMKAVWGWIWGVVQAFVEWWKNTAWPIVRVVIDAVVAYYRFLWNALKAVWGWIFGVIESVVSWFRDTVAPLISTVVGWIVGYYRFLWTKVSEVWGWIWDKIQGFIDWLTNTAWPFIRTAIGYVAAGWQVIVDKLQAAWNAVSEKFTAIKDWLTGTVFGWISGAAATVGAGWNVLVTWLQTAWNNLSTKFTAIKDWIVGTVTGWIGGAVGTVAAGWNVLVTGLQTAWNGLVAKWSEVTGWIGGLKDKIGEKIAGAWNGLVQLFKDAWNGIVSWWNSRRFPGFKFTISFFNQTATIGWDPKDLPDLPHWYAAGGIATRPTIVGIGEAGPEAIVPLSRAGEFGLKGGGNVIHVHFGDGIIHGTKDEIARAVGGAIDEAIGRGTYRPSRLVVSG